MCIVDDLSQVLHQVQPLRDGQLFASLRQPLVEPHRVGVVVEYHRRAEGVVDKIGRPGDTRVVDALKQPELPLRAAPDRRQLRGGGSAGQVEPHPADERGVERVTG